MKRQRPAKERMDAATRHKISSTVAADWRLKTDLRRLAT